MINENYDIIKQLIQPHGLPIASTGSDYHHVWIRDAVYMMFPFLDKDCGTYEKAYHTMLDIFLKYEWKITIHTVKKPEHMFEYIHPRYSLHSLDEIEQEWGNCQHDAMGAFLWGVAKGEEYGKKIIRDENDRRILQKIVDYLVCCQYWRDPDNGMWEEWRELHSSSVGAVVAGLKAIRKHVYVYEHVIALGEVKLSMMYPHESDSRPIDLAQLSLIYPYQVYTGNTAKYIISEVESKLLKSRGVIRYQGDSYYSTRESDGRHLPLEHFYKTEAEWTFGLPWLALCYMELGFYDKAKHYIEWTESVMLENGVLPELYFAGTGKPNPNTPLGWSSSMYILAKERYLKES